MILSNVKRGEDGNYEFDTHLTQQELEFFITYAITTLIQKGLIVPIEQDDPQEIPIPSASQTYQLHDEEEEASDIELIPVNPPGFKSH